MRYDTTLKELFQTPSSKLLELLTGLPAKELLTLEYPSVKSRRPDFVARLADDSIFHLEFQGEGEQSMPWRNWNTTR